MHSVPALMSYRIKTVATLTGITPTTLRAWERRYDVVDPQRTTSGYRVYSERDIATLVRVKSLVDKGFKAGEAIELVRRRAQEPSSTRLGGDSLHHLRSQLTGALLRLDRSTATQVAAQLVATPYDRQIDEVYFPLLRQMGEMWMNGDATVAQEHFASAFVRERLVGMLDGIADPSADAPEAICAGAPGELHEFGLLGAAVHLAMRGWRITYLGADLPVDQIGPVAHQRRPALLCSSLVLSRSTSDCLALAAALRAAAPSGTAVVIGGRGLADGLPPEPAEGIFFLRRISDLFDVARIGAN